MPWRLLLLLSSILLAAPGASAQSADSAAVISASTVRASIAVPADSAPRALYVGLLADRGTHTVLALGRTADGEAEVHAEWDDVMVVQEGAATLLSGGEVIGARVSAPGELRGGRIDGGARRELAAGDLVVVPAGVPHQLLVPPGGSIVYLVVKVRQDTSSTP
jgi:mannose-6-phosphate isomerase-like protein (cupin superfamily)